MTKKFLPYLIALCMATSACTDFDDFSTDTSLRLSFSQDTLFMDTVLTGIPTSTQQIMVYNPNDEALLISSITLADGENTGFRINVDGMSGRQFDNIRIARHDSMYLFVEATLPTQGTPVPTAIRDSIVFLLNGNTQDLKLLAYAQDALSLRGHVVAHDTLMQPDRPVLVYDSLTVAAGARLTLGAGTRLYFHDQAVLHIHGSLSVEGTLQSPVVFRGDRTDRLFPYLPYDRLPGQWGGIRIYPESFDNRLAYADVHGGNFGIRCDSSTTDRDKLYMENSIIHQTAGHALELTNCKASIANSEISNAGGDCVALRGGDYTFTHCTLANFFSWNVREGVALRFANQSNGAVCPLQQARFLNCLITGAGSDELMGEVSEDQAVAFNYYFSHSVIHSIEESNDQIVNVRWEDESNFVLMDDRTQEYNFRPTAESQVIDWGNPADAQAYPLDRDGNPRLTDAAPDAGCYEAQPQDDGQQQE